MPLGKGLRANLRPRRGAPFDLLGCCPLDCLLAGLRCRAVQIGKRLQ
jgi:hypothetical protein